MTDITMGIRIKKRRKSLGFTQAKLAELVNTSVNHISAIETSKENPSLNLLLDLCSALKTTPDFLLMGIARSDDIPQELVEGLRLCDEHTINLVRHIVEYIINNKQNPPKI